MQKQNLALVPPIPAQPTTVVHAKTYLYKHNEEATCGYVLRSGRILLLRIDSMRRRKACGLVLPGETFGEEVLQGGLRRSSALAHDRVEVEPLVLNAARRADLIEHHLMRMQHLQELWLTHEGKERILMVLRRCVSDERKLSTSAIAALAGLGREMGSRIVNSLKKRGQLPVAKKAEQ